MNSLPRENNGDSEVSLYERAWSAAEEDNARKFEGLRESAANEMRDIIVWFRDALGVEIGPENIRRESEDWQRITVEPRLELFWHCEDGAHIEGGICPRCGKPERYIVRAADGIYYESGLITIGRALQERGRTRTELCRLCQWDASSKSEPDVMVRIAEALEAIAQGGS